MILATEFSVGDLIEFIELVKNAYENMGIGAAIGLPFLETLFPFAPLFLMIAFNILAYGVIKGYIYTYFGTLAGTIVVFLFMRYISTRNFKKPAHPKILQVLKWIENTHPLLHIFVLSIPFSPTFLINYSMGLTKMKFTKFLIITAVSRSILLFICIPFGVTLVKYYNSGELGGVTVLWLSITGLVILLGIILGQQTKRQVNNA